MVYLWRSKLGTHFTNAADVSIGFACLQKLWRLHDGLQRFEGGACRDVSKLVVAEPLLKMTDVVADLHAFRPVTQLLAQQQRVERVSADPVEELSEHLFHQLRVDSMQLEHLQERVQLYTTQRFNAQNHAISCCYSHSPLSWANRDHTRPACLSHYSEVDLSGLWVCLKTDPQSLHAPTLLQLCCSKQFVTHLYPISMIRKKFSTYQSLAGSGSAWA